MNEILVTDSLFIFDEHVELLEEKGYKVVRLDNPNASEEELISALKGKVGYILGGVEKVSDKILDSTDRLKAIAFTGTAWEGFISGKETALAKGIKISNAPHLNASAVAEWAFSSAVAMVRNLFALGKTGDKTFLTSPGFKELNIGIVGLGHIGKKVAELFSGVGANVSYWSKDTRDDAHKYKGLPALLSESDVVLFCVSAAAGDGWLNRDLLQQIKNAAIISCLTDIVVDEKDLLEELNSKRIRAFLDWTPKLEGYKNLPLETFYCSNASTAYNTHLANKAASDSAVNSIINLLETGNDQHRVL